MAFGKKSYTVYDAMEERGYFASNPANSFARNPDGSSAYAGPVEFPRMMYHPKGEMVVTRPVELVATPFGPQALNEQKELISRVVKSAEEQEALMADGWHLHPAEAIAASGREAPVTGTAEAASALAKEIAQMQAKLAAMTAGATPKQAPSGPVKK